MCVCVEGGQWTEPSLDSVHSLSTMVLSTGINDCSVMNDWCFLNENPLQLLYVSRN